MRLHGNAPLSWSGLRRLAERVVVEGWTQTAAAEAEGCQNSDSGLERGFGTLHPSRATTAATMSCPETRSGRSLLVAPRVSAAGRSSHLLCQYRRTGFRKRPTIRRRGEDGPSPCYVPLANSAFRPCRGRRDRARLDASPSETGETQTQSPRDEGPVSGHVPSGRKASDVVQPLALLDVVGYIRLPCGRDSNPAPGRCPVQRAVRDTPGAANSSGLSVALQ
jgi:hypothetical protein